MEQGRARSAEDGIWFKGVTIRFDTLGLQQPSQTLGHTMLA